MTTKIRFKLVTCATRRQVVKCQSVRGSLQIKFGIKPTIEPIAAVGIRQRDTQSAISRDVRGKTLLKIILVNPVTTGRHRQTTGNAFANIDRIEVLGIGLGIQNNIAIRKTKDLHIFERIDAVTTSGTINDGHTELIASPGG